nr:hypothetical protein CFP56_22921 [Quercus suber]
MTRFSKQKLAEAQEKKAKSDIVGGLLSRKQGGARRKFVSKPFPPTFWDDTDAAALKVYEALSVDDLNPLMVKLSSDVMSLLEESLFVSGKLLDLEKKVATTEPMIKSLFAENETLKNKVAILTIEAENDKERNLQLKLEKVGPDTVQEFKESDLYSDDLCEYYVEGFELFRTWMAKHHPELDLSSLVMAEMEKVFVAYCPSEVT